MSLKKMPEASKTPDEIIKLADKVDSAIHVGKTVNEIDSEVMTDCNEMDKHLIACWLAFTYLLRGYKGAVMSAFLMSKGKPIDWRNDDDESNPKTVH